MKNLTLFTLAAINLLLSPGTFAKSSDKTVEFLNSKPASARLPFSEIVRVENTLYLSGQIGLDPATKKLAAGGFKAEAGQTLKNIKQTLQAHGYSMEQVVKCTVMLTDIADFKSLNQVYAQYFTPPYPARSTFAVSELALNASIEVECIAVVSG
ncbi:RidA family protein [Thalassomonas viridans]|uniref:RidA family protein n=1 Tax=Thalassomonas viridans TaxID=137584 RepID=A0AAE9Z8Y8_9GAMM|nr:Rid family detoxifying hydrolase [Thalassomonas viridans]WDE08903.1 RidA family protein [Thalassomonas viridans]WDE08950.1 RidA family protein [Thalassomonas viridans]